ncbi:hypothetical protein [Nocardia sp. NRRL S-836]|uniref:hypothetical protein n=1 Tax=Nocardia sp. NRRL S-836 TaxID=1519492 RepID=UPI0006AF7784|nr:hypothetical protein [Nocardia sp. NRRL S-836]KOV84296.1 hypothetical protein ADL03_17080 [Nocardia sp. NRRL S-836]
MLVEALRSGYAVPALLLTFALVTRRVWVGLAQTLRDWVRSAPARRRAGLEEKVVEHALATRSKDQREHYVEMLRLLLDASGRSLPDPPPPDPAPDENPGEGAAHT